MARGLSWRWSRCSPARRGASHSSRRRQSATALTRATTSGRSAARDPVMAETLLRTADAWSNTLPSSLLGDELREASGTLRSLLNPAAGSPVPKNLLDTLTKECQGRGEDPPAVEAVLGILARCCERRGGEGRGLAEVLRAVVRQRKIAAEKLREAQEALRAERAAGAAAVREAELRRSDEIGRLMQQLDAAERREHAFILERNRLSVSPAHFFDPQTEPAKPAFQASPHPSYTRLPTIPPPPVDPHLRR
eukprot:Hpha_TRINITY_DN14146_c0_g2::TRINITY_DN14146_c0_g2_i2::g.11030::m.11030